MALSLLVAVLALIAAFVAGPVNAGTCEAELLGPAPDRFYFHGPSGPDASTAIDLRTGLMWKRCAEGQDWDGRTCDGIAGTYTRDEARRLADAHGFSGHDDWRLPTASELQGLVEDCRTGPASSSTVFPGTPAWIFWSDSVANEWVDGGVSVDFRDGGAAAVDHADRYHVRLVRAGALAGSVEEIFANGFDGEGPLDPGGCVAPTGLTRDFSGRINQSSGLYPEMVNVARFKHVYGHVPNSNASGDKNFPGLSNRDVKVMIAPNHYWALEFRLNSSFPDFGVWQGQPGPAGYWRVNETLADANAWTLSISECPGDFERPASANDPRYKCYAEYRMLGPSGTLQWVGASFMPLAGVCALEKEKRYFLNIAPHPFLGDLAGAQGCTQSTGCRGNFAHIGNFSGVNNPD